LALGFALLAAFSVSSLVLVGTGHSPTDTWLAMGRFGTRPDSVVSVLNRAVPLYFAGLAAATGFQMGLFNIGVEGQYRLAALVAAVVGATLRLPPVLHVALVLLVALAVGAAWAGGAAVLKVRRGVHEVLSTLMLNFVATGLVAALLATDTGATGGGLAGETKLIPLSGRMPALNRLLGWLGLRLPIGSRLDGALVLAVVAGVGYHLLIRRSCFGFELRALGVNPRAARAGGVDTAGVTVSTLLVSGALAGLVGIGPLLGTSYRYSIDFPTGLGFAGIAVALVGRNHPLGVALASLLFAFLDRSAQILDLTGVPREIVLILEAVILLSTVVAYQVAIGLTETREARLAAGPDR
jgi:simple sugar transport system permease protein